MKCPKCGYLGFETSDRCRNCGYDFSLAVDTPPAPELPLNLSEGAGAPLADLDLARRDGPAGDQPAATLDLDRVIGPATLEESFDSERTHRSRRGRTPRAASAPEGGPIAKGGNGATDPTGAGLPLFGSAADDEPLIKTPRPPRPPLSVRRTTPEIPRGRARNVTPRPDDSEFEFPSEARERGDLDHTRPPRSGSTSPGRTSRPEIAAAGAVRRLGAAIIDIVILGSINAVVVYLTLAFTGLTFERIVTLPILPLVMFLAMLNGAYLIAFVAAGGQTIGKMTTSIRVVTEQGGRVAVGGAVIRAVGCGLALVTFGLAYLPAFVTTGGRALQDRIAGTRVVSAR